MSLIIDANCAPETLTPEPSQDFAPVADAIVNRGAKIALGGKKLRSEYEKLPKVWRFIVALEKAGRVISCPDAEIDAIQEVLSTSGALKSDDPHIIALAQVSGARLLCSRDQALHTDFGSKELVSNPRGKVYQTKTHARLLRIHCL
jgi:hypothetical protein